MLKLTALFHSLASAPRLLTLALAAIAVQAVAAPEPRWVTLGTVGGPIVHASAAQISNALVVGDAVYLFDVGNGVLRQMAAAGLPVRGLRGVFISHHHADHNADLGLVMLSKWLFGPPAALPVAGPPGTVALVDALVKANAATELASFGTTRPNPALASAVRAQDLAAQMDTPTLVYEDAQIRVSAISVDHFQIPASYPMPLLPHAVAFRIEAGGRVFVYTGDTGPSKRLEVLARGADLLVSEVVHVAAMQQQLRRSMPHLPPEQMDKMTQNIGRNHLEPQVVGQLATAAQVKAVVLTHFVPNPADMPDPQVYVRDVQAHFSGPVHLGRDLGSFSAATAPGPAGATR